ncbi:subtilisin-like protein [Mycena galopus ATCC 62051]|nr:subtilisin-like protein [Mycena galopus ATCC 62051]
MASWLSTFFSLTLLAASNVAVVTATPRISPLVRHEKRSHVPSGWAHSHKHPSHETLPMRFGLVQSNIDQMDQFITDVAHPDSPNYGKHWTADQVAAKFAPSAESVNTVKEWLISNGIESERIRHSPALIWLDVNVTVAEAEALLNTEYHVYEHESGKKHVSSDSYHVPAHVQPHIDVITPTVHFNAILGKRSAHEAVPSKNHGPPPSVNKPFAGGGNGPSTAGTTSNRYNQLSHCDTQASISPVCLRALYGLNGYTPKMTAVNSFGIVEYTPNAYVPSDIDLFAGTWETDLVGKRPVLFSIDGGVVQTTSKGFNANGESNLDFQYGMSIVTGAQPVTLYQVGDTVEGASFNDLLDALDGSYCTYQGGDDPNQDGIYPDPYGGYQGPKACGTVKPTNVISTSYAYNEDDLTPFYTARQCNEYAKLGLMGVTVLYSSGDYGVAGNGGNCITPSGASSTSGTRFNPSFPGTCPYITSVGATQIHVGNTVLNPESACVDVIQSGGGFSNYFAMPSYQKSQVSSYLTNHPPPYSGAQYNNSGMSRGFPDLSANGAWYAVAVQGAIYDVFGTSASTPVVGGILTLINDARLAAGKSTIGFINPTIYSTAFASAFNDVTNGTNPGCGTAGFTTAKGWDPVTGLGTPNFPKLKNLWLTLP